MSKRERKKQIKGTRQRERGGREGEMSREGRNTLECFLSSLPLHQPLSARALAESDRVIKLAQFIKLARQQASERDVYRQSMVHLYAASGRGPYRPNSKALWWPN